LFQQINSHRHRLSEKSGAADGSANEKTAKARSSAAVFVKSSNDREDGTIAANSFSALGW